MTRETQASTLDETTRAYIECALWSSTDDDGNPLDDDGRGIDDLAPETLAQMDADVAGFLVDVERAKLNTSWWTPEQMGHDFWLTRNGHGAGFWDRGQGETGARLTELCKPFGEVDLYVGDDGRVYHA